MVVLSVLMLIPHCWKCGGANESGDYSKADKGADSVYDSGADDPFGWYCNAQCTGLCPPAPQLLIRAPHKNISGEVQSRLIWIKDANEDNYKHKYRHKYKYKYEDKYKEPHKNIWGEVQSRSIKNCTPFSFLCISLSCINPSHPITFQKTRIMFFSWKFTCYSHMWNPW